VRLLPPSSDCLVSVYLCIMSFECSLSNRPVTAKPAPQRAELNGTVDLLSIHSGKILFLLNLFFKPL
jgi:hypothetical protein